MSATLLIASLLICQTQADVDAFVDRANEQQVQQPILPNRAPKVGDIGLLVDYRAEVIQVWDESTALMRITHGPLPGVAAIVRGSIVRRADPEVPQITVCVEGINTKGLHDGKTVGMPGVWWFAGTKSYQDKDNAKRTVLLMKPFDISPLLDRLPKKKQ